MRAKAREVGAEMHVVKNTLFDLALDKFGVDAKEYLEQTSLVGFAFNDAPALAKVVNDAVKTDVFKVKGGLLGKRNISASDVKALADMPPLPVVRAQLLGVLVCAGFQAGPHHQRARSRFGRSGQSLFREKCGPGSNKTSLDRSAQQSAQMRIIAIQLRSYFLKEF